MTVNPKATIKPLKFSNMEARIFLTDYASYNEGSQFEFGHWVDLSDFSDADELNEYIENHFKECDEKRPLLDGSPREEIMITDFEGFPADLYSECMDFAPVYEWLDLEGIERVGYEYLIEMGNTHEYAIEHAEEPIIWEICGESGAYTDARMQTLYRIFEELYPDADKAEESNPYLRIDYDSFESNELYEFTDSEGDEYYILRD